MTRSKSFAKLLPLRKKDSKDLKILQEEDQAKYSTNVLYDASLLAEQDFQIGTDPSLRNKLNFEVDPTSVKF